MPAGTFQLVGLEYVRESLAADWNRHREAIHSVVEGVFRRYLVPADAYYRIDHEHFLILFTHLPRQQVEAKAESIARESGRLIAGLLPPGHDTTVMSRVAEVDREILMEKVNSLEALLDYIKFGTLVVEENNHAKLFDAFEEEMISPTASATATNVGPGPDMADFDQSLSALFQKKTPAAYLKECNTCFAPLFDTRRKSFTGFQVMVMRGERPALEEDDPLIDNPDELRFHVDRYALLSAALGLQRIVAQQGKGLIVIPVHYDTLAVSRTRSVYLQRLREVPPGYLPYIGFIIVGMPRGTPAGRIADVVSYIQPLSQWQAVALPPDPRQIDVYGSSNCKAFATSARVLEDEVTKQTENLFAFARRARDAQAECVLFDVDNRDAVHFGMSAGFSLMVGRAVGGPCREPEPFDSLAKPV